MGAFFPTYKDQFTRTPNIFYDKILTDPEVTLNQVRLVGYLIRQTIGYNREAKWAAVSRKSLIKNAGIPNGRIKDSIDGCLKKGWILVFEHGQAGKQERYIFLNDPINQRIVYGLNKGLFSIEDLEYLNLAGIERLLEKHGIPETPTETVEEQEFPPTETVEGTPTETGGGTPTETVEGEAAGNQTAQGAAGPLNTSLKYKVLNTDVVVEEYRNLFSSLFKVTPTDNEVVMLLSKAHEQGRELGDAIRRTWQYADLLLEAEGKKIENPVGAVQYEIVQGWNTAPLIEKIRKKQAAEPKIPEGYTPYNWLDKARV